MAEIQLATVLLGAKGFKEGNVNDTFRGQVLLGDGSQKQAIIKDLDACQLCNELLAFCLARDLGLPIPDCYLGFVEAGALNVSKAPQLPDGSGRLVFVSVDVMVPNITFQLRGADIAGRQSLFNEIVEWVDLGHLYAFDSWIANIDRHPGNLLFGGADSFWLIDHGHCFSGPNWIPSKLDPGQAYMNRLSQWLTSHLSKDQRKKRSKEIQAFETLLNNVDVSKCLKNSRIEGILSPNKVAAVKDFVVKRVGKVAYFSNQALGIPTIV